MQDNLESCPQKLCDIYNIMMTAAIPNVQVLQLHFSLADSVAYAAGQ